MRLTVSALAFAAWTAAAQAQVSRNSSGSNATEEAATATSDGPCAADYSQDYDTNLHVAALFTVMAFSFAGTMAPIIGRKIAALGNATDLPFQCGKLFGAGVILATAWVHMFSPADQALTNSCLPELFTKTYTSWAGALALLAALSTHLIQFFASRAIRKQLGHTHGTSAGPLHVAAADCIIVGGVLPSNASANGSLRHDHHGHDNHHAHGDRGSEFRFQPLMHKDSRHTISSLSQPNQSQSHVVDDALVEKTKPSLEDDGVPIRTSTTTLSHRQQSQQNLPPLSPLVIKPETPTILILAADNHTGHSHNNEHILSPSSSVHAHPLAPTLVTEVHDHTTGDEHGHHLILLKEKHVTTYILELGIASHSLIIGLTLGVARGGELKSLIVALTFHQFFEGLALSTVVLESNFEKNFMTLAMVLFYTLTTPAGIAIGIGLSSVYNANGQTALITQGVLDALSAGILAYDALVNIIFMHFSAPALLNQPDWKQGLQIFSLWLGAGIMAVIGRWT